MTRLAPSTASAWATSPPEGAAPIIAITMATPIAASPRTPATPKPGRHEHLDGERDEAETQQENFLPAREAEHEARTEEESQRGETEQSAETERPGLDLEDESEDAERKQQRRDDRIGEKAHHLLGPVRVDEDDLALPPSPAASSSAASSAASPLA